MSKLVIVTNPLTPTDSQLLDSLLAQCGIQRGSCLVLCVTTSDLAAQLGAYAPNCCLLLGHIPLALFAGKKRNIKDWRGYVWRADAVLPGVKCVVAWDMPSLRMDFGLTGEQKFYIARAVREARSEELVVPYRFIFCHESKLQLLFQLQEIRERKRLVAIDIEGGCGMGPACIGFATSAKEAVVVPFHDVDGCSVWSEEDEIELWTAVEAVLEDSAVPKTLQNALYELFVMGWSVGTCIAGIVGDTMLKHFELYCELDKSLEFQAVLYTQQPFWKLTHREVDGRYVPFRDGRRATTEEWLIYNGTDCCVTYEIDRVLEARLAPRQREHYLFNVSLLVPLAYMSLRGFRYDKDEAARMLADTTQRIYELQDEINREAARSPERPALRQFYEALGVTCPIGTDVQRPIVAVAPKHVLRPAHKTDMDVGRDELVNAQSAGASVSRQKCGGDELHMAPAQASHTGGTGEVLGGGDAGAVEAQVSDDTTAKLLPLLTSAFCCAPSLRAEWREVEETHWEARHWNGKKWVKRGPRLTEKEVATHSVNRPFWIKGTEAPPTGCGLVWIYPYTRPVKKRFLVEVTSLAGVRRFTLESKRAACKRATAILLEMQNSYRALDARDEVSGEYGTSSLTPAQRGELATLLGLSVNINSTSQGGDAQWLLYTHWGLPKQYQREGNKLTDKLTSDDEAIIKAWVQSSKKADQRDARALTMLQLRRHVTQTKYLRAQPDPDGRIRSSINLVATPTCRMAMYGSPTGSSDLNLQTIGKKLRKLFKADEGCLIGQRDLDNSDAYSVAAYCAMLGDRTMLEDALARLKPAKILARIYTEGPQVNQLTRDQLKEECKKVDGEGWLYFACKRVLHGTNYGMGKITMANQILTDSYKLLGEPVWLEPAACEAIQRDSFFVRYPGVKRWHDWMKTVIKQSGLLVTSTGFQRRIFGRKNSHDTLKECLSHYPQYYTTYAIKLALLRQWQDVENRRLDGSMRVEPLLVVHDSKVIQWRVEDTDFAKRKDAEWFANPIRIAQEVITIPASGTFGESWGEQTETL